MVEIGAGPTGKRLLVADETGQAPSFWSEVQLQAKSILTLKCEVVQVGSVWSHLMVRPDIFASCDGYVGTGYSYEL